MKCFLFLVLICSTCLAGTFDAIKVDQNGPNRVGHLFVGGHDTPIGQGTLLHIRKALEAFREQGVAFVLLELDTPGGELFAAQKISDLLKEMDSKHGIPVVAYINNWAISAGAMLAYSARYIATVKDASMGAAEPITGNGEKTSEKINSAVRADFANRAAYFDRNPYLAEAMVDPDAVVVRRGEEIIKLDQKEHILPEDTMISPKGKLLTLTAKQLHEFGISAIQVLPENYQTLKESGLPLLFADPFFKTIPQVELISYTKDWKLSFFTFLASPAISSLLMLGLMFGLYMEFSTPGFGAFGALALFCLFLVILSSFATEVASWLELLLLIGGVALIMLEVFVIPGFGLTGILGIVLALGGLIMLVLPSLGEVSFDFSTFTFNSAGTLFFERLMWLLVTFCIGTLMIVILTRVVGPKFGLFNRLVLKDDQEGVRVDTGALRVGEEGFVMAPLRTAGTIRVGERTYDAQSKTRFISEGARVRIVDIEGTTVIVEEIEC